MSDTAFQDNVLHARAAFNPTCWTEIAAAGAGDEVSLNDFCQRYWHPLYAFARRSGQSVSGAQDLTQDFFSHFLAKDKLQDVKEGKGSFRNFLLILFKRFMINEYTKANAQKRGGHLVKMDFDETEEWLASQTLAPDEIFNKAWALATIEQVMNELQTRFEQKKCMNRFELMRPHLDNTSDLTYKESASQLGCSENSFKVSMHRLKKEFGKVLRLKVESTLENSSEIDEELRFLSEVLRK